MIHHVKVYMKSGRKISFWCRQFTFERDGSRFTKYNIKYYTTFGKRPWFDLAQIEAIVIR